MPASINTADTANLFRHVSANEQIRAPAKTTVAVSSISWHAHWTIVDGTGSGSSAGRMASGANYPVPPRAVSGRWA
ncbi:hypothetical protein LJR029_006861 [Caballeronia sp. LjRoot29]|uniref:hypothetical protein n=1 Tax=Caballeronia sp. LjRoot29 TaxID=3342315 RepID=UPI003ED10C3D